MASVSNEQFLMAVINSMMGKIDFKEVAKQTGLKEGAARMRWTRYKEKLNAASTSATTATPIDSDEESPDEIDKLKKGPKKPVSNKTPSKKSVEKATPKKRKLEEDGDADTEATTIKDEDD